MDSTEGDNLPTDDRSRPARPPAAPPTTAASTAVDESASYATSASGYVPPSSPARDFAVDLVKLFITFATAGLAFLMGGVFSGKIVLPACSIIVCLVLLAASVACGIFFFMNAVAGLETGTYSVTARGPSRIAALQFLFFFLAAFVLGGEAIVRAGVRETPAASTQIDIHTTGRWTVDTAGGIAIHKDHRSHADGAASVRIRAVSDGLALRLRLDTGSASAKAPLALDPAPVPRDSGCLIPIVVGAAFALLIALFAVARRLAKSRRTATA